MSRKLIAMAICLALLLSSFLAKANSEEDINMDEICKTIKTDEAAVLALYNEAADELKSIVLEGKPSSPAERTKMNLRLKAQLTSTVQSVSEKKDQLLVEKRVNPCDLEREESSYSMLLQALTGLVVLSNIQVNENGITSSTDCSHKKQVLEANNHKKAPPNNKLSGTDILAETVRARMCGEK